MVTMKKGISPLIAAVILLAFTIAIASLGSGFFIGFTKEQKFEAGREGKEVMECSKVIFEIDPDSVINNAPDNVSVLVNNRGDSVINDLIITTFNSTHVVNGDAVPSSIDSAVTERVRTNSTVSGGLDKISVVSENCPGMKSIIEKNDEGKWILLA